MMVKAKYECADAALCAPVRKFKSHQMGPITPITNSFRSVQTCHRFENWSASAKCFSSFTTLLQETSIQKVRLLGEDNGVAEEHIGYRIAFLQYRRRFWWITNIFAICGEFSSANICEALIFSPYIVIYLLPQLSELLLPYLYINFEDSRVI